MTTNLQLLHLVLNNKTFVIDKVYFWNKIQMFIKMTTDLRDTSLGVKNNKDYVIDSLFWG